MLCIAGERCCHAQSCQTVPAYGTFYQTTRPWATIEFMSEHSPFLVTEDRRERR